VRAFATATPLIITVSAIAAMIAYVRTDHLADPATVEERGRLAAARRDAVGFGLLALVLGTLAALLFSWLDSFWDPTRAVFAALGIGAAVALSIAAAIVRPKVGLGGVREVAALNVLCGVAYGVALPLLLH
jgi:hypothetical protein